MKLDSQDFRHLKDSAMNASGYAVPFVLGAAALPVLIAKAGLGVFSVLAVMWGALALLSLPLSGFARYATLRLAREEAGTAGLDAAGTAMTLQLACSLPLAAGLFFGAGPLAELIFGDAIPGAAQALRCGALCVPFGALAQAAAAPLEARRAFGTLNAARIVFESIYIALVPAVFLLGGGLREAALGLAAGKAAEAATLLFLCGKAGLPLRPALVPEQIRPALAFAGPVAAQRLSFQAADEAGKLITGVVCGLEGLAVYVLPHELYRKAAILPSGMGAALFPALGAADPRKTYLRAQTVTAAVTLPLYAAAAAAAPALLSLLSGGAAGPEGAAVLRLLLLARFLSGFTYQAAARLQVTGRARLSAGLSFISLLIFSVLAWLGAKAHGPLGVAAVWAAKGSFDAAVFLAAAAPAPAYIKLRTPA